MSAIVLKKIGIRPTTNRILIYNYLSTEKKAVSLSDLESCFASMDRATLYRTIKIFEEAQLVHQIDDGSGIPKYARCNQNAVAPSHDDTHLHFHCLKCKKTSCLTNCQIPKIQVPNHYQVSEVTMMIKGTCDECSRA
ncbi:transcriptional repressor [Aquimarina sp. TRL1]|uniref:Fur family transcriptional regulator n=1 Tax=Aquimarina sp. (strain TRL1) TaxID=2736252 RepID=UPI00158CB56C|nr:transcriptional repressor [Aquimarina sp. TRL1]QKX06693.1 transcriptional repressor [Aquimarina sp. TRL1]